MSWKRTSVCAVTTALLAVLPGAAAPSHGQGGGGSKTVTVDCSTGQTIANALQQSAQELTIDIVGICDEDVQIDRDNVTLRGTDPNNDGIRGVKPADEPGGVLTLRDARNIRIESLGILDGLRHGIDAQEVSGLVIEDSRIVGHASMGLTALDVLFVRISDTEIRSGNRAVQAIGDVRCTRCTIHGDVIGWIAFDGQQGIADSTVTSGAFGVFAQTSASLGISGSSLSGDFLAVGVVADGSVGLGDSTIDDGFIDCEDKSSLTVSNTQQINNSAGDNYFLQDCSVFLDEGSKLEGRQLIDRFSKMTIQDSSLVDGDLICAAAGDAFCDDPLTQVTGTSNCSQCM